MSIFDANGIMSRSSSETTIGSLYASAIELNTTDRSKDENGRPLLDNTTDRSKDENGRPLLDNTTDRSKDENGRPLLDEINTKSEGKNILKDHKYCFLSVAMVLIVIISIFIIIYYNHCQPTREYSSVSGICANCTKENKTEEKDFPSKEVKNTELQYTHWGTKTTFIIQTHRPVSLVLRPYDEETTLMICKNNRTWYELFCDSRTKHSCPYVPVNKLVTIRNETETKDEQIIVDIVTECIDQKVGIKWDM